MKRLPADPQKLMAKLMKRCRALMRKHETLEKGCESKLKRTVYNKRHRSLAVFEQHWKESDGKHGGDTAELQEKERKRWEEWTELQRKLNKREDELSLIETGMETLRVSDKVDAEEIGELERIVGERRQKQDELCKRHKAIPSLFSRKWLKGWS